MPTYLVECVLPGADLESVEGLCRAAAAACQRCAAEGKPIRYLRTTFAPGWSRCSCLFDAPNADLVQAVSEAAQIPYSRIALAVDLPNGESQGLQPAMSSMTTPMTDKGEAP
jgi:hypothetical protein